MKKYLFIIMAIFSLIAIASAEVTTQATSSGLLNGSGIVVARPARFTDLTVITDGTNQATVVCYDNASTNSGNVIGKVIVPGASLSGGIIMSVPVRASLGIYCTLAVANSGTGAFIVSYDPQ